MKLKNFLFGMMACAAFTACSNEEVVDGGEQPVEGKSYIAVNIVVPSGNSTRALEGFDNGTEAESKVANATFLFFDASGNGCAAPYTTTLPGDWTVGDASVSGYKISPVTLILDNATAKPAQVVAILNPKSGDTFSQTTKLSDLKTDDWAKDYLTGLTGEGAFVMSNSVYADGGKAVEATPVPQIYQTAEAAKANPITIPVERVVAKVSATEKTGGIDVKVTSDNKVNIDGAEQELTVEINGWEVLGNTNSFLLKNINPAWTGTWWNDAANMRSYWATSAKNSSRTGYSWTSMTNKDAKYVQETTTDNNAANPAYLLVSATIKAKDGAAISLVDYAGEKYTETGFKNIVASSPSMSKYWRKVVGDGGAATYEQFNASWLALNRTENVAYRANPELTTEASAYTFVTGNMNGQNFEDEETVTVEAVKADLAKFNDVKFWNGGATYYFAKIEQASAAQTGSAATYGVVRNHVYQIELSSINGFGTPVADHNHAIYVPETPTDDKTYLAAKVMVLKWKVVKQQVDLSNTDK